MKVTDSKKERRRILEGKKLTLEGWRVGGFYLYKGVGGNTEGGEISLDCGSWREHYETEK